MNELPSAICLLLCNNGGMNDAMTILEKLYKQDGQTGAIAIFIVGQMPVYIKLGDFLGLLRCWQLSIFTSELTLLPIDPRKSSFMCLTATILFSSRFLIKRMTYPVGFCSTK